MNTWNPSYPTIKETSTAVHPTVPRATTLLHSRVPLVKVRTVPPNCQGKRISLSKQSCIQQNPKEVERKSWLYPAKKGQSASLTRRRRGYQNVSFSHMLTCFPGQRVFVPTDCILQMETRLIFKLIIMLFSIWSGVKMIVIL